MKKNNHNIQESELKCFNANIDDFLLSLKIKRYSFSTVKSYSNALKRFFIYLQKVNISRLQNVDIKIIENYHAMLTAQGISINSINVYIRIVRQFFEHLEKTGAVFINPMNDFGKIQLEKKTQSCPTMKEMNLLLEQPDVSTDMGIRDRAILETAYSAGLRIEELTTIKISDADLRNGLLKVVGKGKKERVVPLGKHAVSWIDKYLKYVRPKLAELNVDENYLWLGNTGRIIISVTIGQRIHKYAEQAGIETNITVHAIRRACATHMLKNGAHPVQLQMLLGHANLRNLGKYLKLDLNDIKAMHQHSRTGQ